MTIQRKRPLVRKDGATARIRRDGVEGVSAIEIEPGRGVPNNWDRALFERWAERKARRRQEQRREA